MSAVARKAGARFIGLWIDGPREVLARRIARRRADVSDATVAVLDRHEAIGAGPMDWRCLDGARDAAHVLESAKALC